MENIERITFICETKELFIDGEGYVINIENIEPKNLRAIQWYKDWGEFEYTDQNNEQFFDIELLSPLISMWEEAKKKIEEEQRIQMENEEKENSSYIVKRKKEYPPVEEQIAAIVKVIDALLEQYPSLKIEEYQNISDRIQDVKNIYPKEVDNSTTETKIKNKKSKK